MSSNKAPIIFRIIFGTLLVPLLGDWCVWWYFTNNPLFFIQYFSVFALSFVVALCCVILPVLLVRLWIELTHKTLMERLTIACLLGLLLACLLVCIMPVGVWIAASLIATVISELLVYAVAVFRQPEKTY